MIIQLTPRKLSHSTIDKPVVPPLALVAELSTLERWLAASRWARRRVTLPLCKLHRTLSTRRALSNPPRTRLIYARCPSRGTWSGYKDTSEPLLRRALSSASRLQYSKDYERRHRHFQPRLRLRETCLSSHLAESPTSLYRRYSRSVSPAAQATEKRENPIFGLLLQTLDHAKDFHAFSVWGTQPPRIPPCNFADDPVHVSLFIQPSRRRCNARYRGLW